MGDACQEIEELRQAAATQPSQAASKVCQALLGKAGYDEVVVDVLAGTSAGGLNAAPRPPRPAPVRQVASPVNRG
jgi:hypothetical protein